MQGRVLYSTINFSFASFPLLKMTVIVPFINKCTALQALFNALPSTLPESLPGSKLPPSTDPDFAAEEGPWAAYNKAMHAAFGDKTKGLKISEQGPALLQTISVTKQCLLDLLKQSKTNEMELVGLWIDALQLAAKEAGAIVPSGMISFPFEKNTYILSNTQISVLSVHINQASIWLNEKMQQ
jgi:hypothetical protein